MKKQKFVPTFLMLVAMILCQNCSTSTPVAKSKNPSEQLKILTYNVRNCKGMDLAVDYDRVSDIIRRSNADCVAIQELDSATRRYNGAVALDELAKRTKMFGTYNASIDFQGGKYGIGILTKEKPVKTTSVSLPGREEKRSFLLVEMKDYVFCCTHLSLTEEDRMTSVEIINKITAAYKPKPVFLCGDFNADADSPVIKKLLENWMMLSDSSKPTFPSDKPTTCIDYVFVKKNSDRKIMKVVDKTENEPVASDHLPVFVEVKINKP